MFIVASEPARRDWRWRPYTPSRRASGWSLGITAEELEVEKARQQRVPPAVFRRAGDMILATTAAMTRLDSQQQRQAEKHGLCRHRSTWPRLVSQPPTRMDELRHQPRKRRSGARNMAHLRIVMAIAEQRRSRDARRGDLSGSLPCVGRPLMPTQHRQHRTL